MYIFFSFWVISINVVAFFIHKIVSNGLKWLEAGGACCQTINFLTLDYAKQKERRLDFSGWGGTALKENGSSIC